MATIETAVSLNMLTGFDFGKPLHADAYYGDSDWYISDHLDGTSEFIWGYDFTFGADGALAGTGTISYYSVYGNFSNDLLVSIDGISLPVGSLLSLSNLDITRTILAGADFIYGSAYADVLYGFDGDDAIDGGAGNDRLEGGAGADAIDGGEGNDTASYAGSAAGVAVSLATGTGSGGDAEGDTLQNVENLLGSNLADRLTGDAGANTLDGGAGADTLRGMAGNDVYLVDNAGDIVDETGGSGTDTVRSSISFSLANTARVLGSVENLVLLGSANLGATGNALANVLTGNAGANTLDGGAGADTLRGMAGNDVYAVDNAGDIVDETGGSGADTVRSSISFSLANTARVLGSVENLVLLGSANLSATGNALANVLTGNAGANTLDGGAGADTLRGMAGNDVYLVDNAGDIVDETGGSGTDTVRSSISFSLANAARALGSVENLALLGSANLGATGNALANVLTGNAGANTLDGGAGADTLRGMAGNDVYAVDNAGDIVDETGGSGTDTVRSSISFSLANAARVLGSVENLALLGSANLGATGNALANVLTGNAGANTLDGGTGADTLRGMAGNDVYLVDDAGDIVDETGGSGTDTVRSSISFSLANAARVLGSVENLALLGNANLSATGNALANVLTGNAGNNVLTGGAGNDTLTGGAGHDYFVLNAAPNASTNVDRITDFNVADDTIRLENAVMPGLGSSLTAANFWKSTTGLAHDANDHIIYETDTGWLYYDSNGSASGGAVHIATLAPNLALTYADFVLI